MGLLDSFDYDALLKKLLEGQAQPDSRAPFSQGLMAMGAQMLANSNRDFGSALGAGGMGYLEASNAERTRQQKDPMQQINMANAVMGLRERAENQKAMADWQRQLGGQPQAQSPQFGMQDRSMGEMPQAAPMAQGELPQGVTTSPLAPQTNIPSLQIVNAGMNSPSSVVRSWAKNIWETNYKPQNLTVGAKLLQGDKVVAENPNLPQGMEPAPDGSVRVKPNFPQSAAAIAGAVKTAEAESAAKVADQYAPPATLTRAAGGTDTVSPATARLAVRWDIPAPMAREITTQFPQEQWDNAAAALKQVGGKGSGGAANFDPQTGSVQSVRPGNQASGGYGTPSATEAASAMIPIEAQKAAAIQAATAAGKAQEALTADSYKTQLADLKESYKSANTAKEVLMSINESRDSLEKGAITGGFGKRKIEGLNFVNGLLPTTYQIAPELLGNSQRLASSLGQQLVKHAKDLGFNPSNADAKRLEKVIGDEGVSEKGIRAILDFQEKMARQGIDQHNKIAKQASDKGALPLFEYNVEAPEPYKSTVNPPRGEPPAKGAQWNGSAWTMTQMIGGKPTLLKWVP